MKNLIGFMQALWVAILTVIVYSILMLPWRVWRDSYRYLQRMYTKEHFLQDHMRSELLIITWISLILSCLIFIMYPVGVLLIISLFFKGFTWKNILGKMLFLFLVTYFGPLLLTFIKELFSIRLLQYFKLESIEELLTEIQEKKLIAEETHL